MKRLKTYLVLITVISISFSCGNKELNYIKKDGIEKVSFRVQAFEIEDVKLLEGPFLHATQLNKKILLNYEPDRLLAKFRVESGLKPKAKNYDGWENETLAGHSLGHYLSACALMYKTTEDTIFLNRANYIIEELNVCQQAEGSGYLGAAPGAKRIFEEEVSKGDIRSQGFDLNGIWAPLYTQHKIMAGLLDAFTLCDNKTGLVVAKKFADWMDQYLSRMTRDQIQKMMNCEIGGISESLANLYSLTNEKKYLDLANKFYHDDILKPLSEGIDILPGKHANTQIPKLIGLSRIYELTADTLSKETAEFFWDRVVNHHSYVTGGHCNHEYFGPPDTLRNRLSQNTTETCNVYNMLKLSKHLFEWHPKAEIADFYERALFNHILSAQHPKSGWVIYNLSLEMGGHKTYQDPEWFTCCVGTGMETHAKYSKNIYYHNNDELFVGQYIASRLNWKEKGLTLEQNTKFPEEQGSQFLFNCNKPIKLALKIRYPYWCEKGFSILVNKKKQNIKQQPGSYVEINRTWKDGDIVEVIMPFSLRIETMPDDEKRVAFFNGPLVLAGDLGQIEDSNAYDAMFVPVIIAQKEQLNQWLLPINNEVNTFKTKDVGQPKDITLKPFYSTHDRRYSIYWDIYTKEKWEEFQIKYVANKERQKKIEKITIDFFQPGEMQPERNHKFKDDKSWVGEHKGRKYRETNNWITCVLQVNKKGSNTLMVDYWGGYPGSKTFDILVDGHLVGTEDISNINAGEFVIKEYSIPNNITLNKTVVTVKFQAHKGNRAGPIFGVRTVKK